MVHPVLWILFAIVWVKWASVVSTTVWMTQTLCSFLLQHSSSWQGILATMITFINWERKVKNWPPGMYVHYSVVVYYFTRNLSITTRIEAVTLIESLGICWKYFQDLETVWKLLSYSFYRRKRSLVEFYPGLGLLRIFCVSYINFYVN